MVKTDLGTVRVLGTSFNVFVDDELLIVSCKTGKVEISGESYKEILTPGQELRFIGENISVEKIQDPEKIASWRNEESTFDSVRLLDVVKKMELIYNVSIELPSQYQNELITGGFVHDDIQKALKMVFLPMGIEYNKSSDTLIIVE